MFTQRASINRLSVAIILSFTVSIIFNMAYHPEKTPLVREGDFPAFYAAAVLLNEGQAAHLYDKDWQDQIQQRHWPDGFLYFRYPPFVALLLKPLAFFGPLQAKLILFFLMSFFLIAAFRFASIYAPVLKINWLATYAVLTVCAPVMSGLLCGQNSALNLLLYSLILYGLHQASDEKEYGAGIAAGLMLYKPQLGLIWCLWLLLSRCKKIIFPLFSVGIVLYLLGAIPSGFLWPYSWLKQTLWAVQPIWSLDSQVMISLNGVAYAITRILPQSANALSHIILKGSYVLSIVIFLWMSYQFWQAGKIQDAGLRRSRLFSLMLLGGPATLLISAHTMFYDFGICILSCAFFFNLKNQWHRINLLLALILIDLGMIFREQFPIQPVFFVTLACFFFIASKMNRTRKETRV